MDTDAMPRRFGRESVWVLAMTMLGAGVRLKGLGTLGLDHFDEGIYAQAAAWVFAEGGLRAIDPGLIPYAPPGYPILVGLFYQAIGPLGITSILVSILSGIVTIPVLAILARHCFGQGAGGATASLVALSGSHVVFCRTGLTDASFLLAWSLAIIAGVRFLERPGISRAAWLGVLVGLAQLVKYNGAMTGVIVALAVVVAAARPGDGRRLAPRTLGYGLFAAGIAALVYLPWFLFVERTTGYASLLEHHRGYVDGPSRWLPNWQQQMAQATALAGRTQRGISWFAISVSLAWIGAAIGQGRSVRSWGRFKHIGPLLALFLAALSLVSPANLTYWAALAWAPALLILDPRPSSRLIALWFLFMAATTPLYHPYARLWLPTLAASWVLGGGLIAGVLCWLRGIRDDDPALATRPGWKFTPVVIITGMAVALALIGPLLLPERVRWFPDPLSRSDGSRRAADAILAGTPSIPLGAEAPPVLLYTRPTVRFAYLLAGGASPIQVLDRLDALRTTPAAPGTIALVDAGLGVRMTPELRLEFQEAGWEVSSSLVTNASIATLLDVRPESVYEPSDPLLGGEQPEPLDAPPFASNEAGRCVFWIITRQ